VPTGWPHLRSKQRGRLYLLVFQKIEPSPFKRKVTVGEIVSCVCQQFSLKEQMLSGLGKDRRLPKVRAIAAWLVLDSGVLTLAELSKRVNRDPSTLSTSARDLERQAQTDIQLAQLMSKIKEELYKIPLSKA